MFVKRQSSGSRFITVQSLPAIFLSLILVCLVISTAWTYISSRVSNSPSTNRLATGEAWTGLDSYSVILAQPLDFNGLSYDQILTLRRDTAETHRILLAGPYKPTGQVFSPINAALPWYSLQDLYLTGNVPGRKESYPESAASRLVINPFLLVRADFWGLSRWGDGNLVWDSEHFCGPAIQKKNTPLYPREDKLTFFPKQKRAEIVYDVKRFITAVNEVTTKPLEEKHTAFGLHFQNAKDMGLNYVRINKSGSANLEDENFSDALTEIISYFGAVPIKGKKGSFLNYHSPSPPGYELIRVKSLPADIRLDFWEKLPEPGRSDPDFIFVIRII